MPPPFRLQAHDLRRGFDAVSLNAAHAVTIAVIIFSNPSGDRDTMPELSEYIIPNNVWPSYSFSCLSILPARALPSYFPSFSVLWSCTMLSMMTASAVKRFSATCSTTVKKC